MRMLHFSTSDIAGGAALAAYRLHRSLRDAGADSSMFVRRKQSGDPSVQEVPFVPWYSSGRRLVWRTRWTRKRFLPKPTYMFNLDIVPGIDMRKIDDFRQGGLGVICLHWITDFLGPESIRVLHERLRSPILWVLMDIEPLTGGCHYAFGCDGFTRRCGNCPQLGSRKEKDRSRRLWERKRNCLQGIPIVLVAVTSWVETRIRESSLFSGHRIVHIPLAIDTKVFRPADPRDARDALGVPRDMKAIFFGSARFTDPRKGMGHLRDALLDLASRVERPDSRARKDQIILMAAGEGDRSFLDSLPFRRIELGFLREPERLAMAYQAADLFVCPSVEDAGPMMIPEAMLCGTPVVAFDTGGAPDLVRTLVTGYLARYADRASLAEGLHVLLNCPDLRPMRAAAREAALRRHDPLVVASQYLALQRELAGTGN